jgi:hypothetical protein
VQYQLIYVSVKHWLCLQLKRQLSLFHYISNLWVQTWAWNLCTFAVFVAHAPDRDSGRDYFKQLKILPLQSQYMFSILMFVAKNINYYKFHSDIHNINTRHIIDLYQPSSSLSVFNNGIFNMSVKIFNKLHREIKILVHDIKLFKKNVKEFLLFQFFLYSTWIFWSFY